MQLRDFGRTGLRVTPLGLGLAALGRPGYLNLGHGQDFQAGRTPDDLRARTFEVLDAAWAGGIRFLDAARSYGQAEVFLGAWLRERRVPAQAAVLESKWGYTYTAGWQVQAEQHEVKQHSLATLERQWPETEQALGRLPDAYLIHSATLESGVLQDRLVLERLARLRAGGLRVGLSLSGPGQAETLRRALELRVEGEPLFQVVQATWNLLEPSAGAALSEAHEAGWGVVIKEALANGRLTARGPQLPAALAEACRELDSTPDALALAAALQQPFVHTVLSGAASVEQLASNLRAVGLARLPGGLETLAEPPAHYWQTRAGLPWT
ncbi:aldo/keto reductase [Deinococcus sonorensis]|uniref:Aldo/keto reductase n=2 Tax=Deinococcus sonorensis TaxID=309891 RepID=A0AAU7UBI1_9DEIO